jgi:hypothetical protein
MHPCSAACWLAQYYILGPLALLTACRTAKDVLAGVVLQLTKLLSFLCVHSPAYHTLCSRMCMAVAAQQFCSPGHDVSVGAANQRHVQL